MSGRGQKTNPYAQAYDWFQQESSKHELSVIHEDGLYRHLRMQTPGTGVWSWDIITWPGYLATVGDVANGYLFSRDADMIEFFTRPVYARNYYSDGSPQIDFRYWREKICGPARKSIYEWDRDKFLAHAREHISNPIYERSSEEQEDLLFSAGLVESQEEAYQWIFDHVVDYDEWDMNEFDLHFLFTCYAIDATVERYNALSKDKPLSA